MAAEDGEPLLAVDGLQHEIVAAHFGEFLVWSGGVAMAGIDDGVVGERREQSETVEHRRGIASR